MKYVLLFFVWLTLCYSSLSANETALPLQKETQISTTTKVSLGKKKKSSNFTKIKVNSTKARPSFAQSILPNLPFNINTKPTLPITLKILDWRIHKKFSYQYIFSYLYPKHAFW